jgi:hypothetical protein
MKSRNDQTISPAGSLQVEIVETLDAHGIDPETYTLYEYIDPDALKMVVFSADSNLEVRLTIEDVRLSITQDGVRSLE